MTRIDIKTDGTRYKQLVSLHERQIESLKPYEEREKQAYKAYNQAVSDSVMKAPADTDEQTDELLRNELIATQKYQAAVENGRDASKRAVATAVELVAELLHDNIDTLDGESLNDKAVFLALNEALPDDIYIATNKSTTDTVLYVEGGANSLRMAQYLNPNNGNTYIRPCRTDSDTIDKERYMNDYDQGLYTR